MKHFLSRLTIFFLIMPLGWGILFIMAMLNSKIEGTFIAQERDWGFVNSKSMDWCQSRHSTSFDVLAFGSSTCYSGIDPRAFETRGVQLFNFCSSAQSIAHSLPLIEAAFNDQTPKVLLLDVYPANWVMETISSEPVRDWIVNGNLWDAHWAYAYAKLSLASHSPFALMTMLYYPIRRKFSAAGERATEDPNGIYRGSGFVFRTFNSLLDMPKTEATHVAMSSTACNSLTQIAALCEAAEVEMVLVNPPQLVEEIFEKPACAHGLTWIDGNEWSGAKNPANFYDDHHLVGDGAARYSEWLSLKLLDSILEK